MVTGFPRSLTFEMYAVSQTRTGLSWLYHADERARAVEVMETMGGCKLFCCDFEIRNGKPEMVVMEECSDGAIGFSAESQIDDPTDAEVSESIY